MIKELPVREPTSEFLRRRKNIEEITNLDRKESLYTEEFYQRIENLPLSKLCSYHRQARSCFDEDKIAALAQTIKEHGIRQPLTVIPCEKEPGIFEVISGERRMRAAKLVALERVPCIVIHDQKQAREIALIENLQREDLHPIEEGEAYKGLIQEGICLTQEEVAQKLGVPRSTVIEKMKFASVPQSIATRILENNIKTRISLRKITTCKDEKEMHTLINYILGNEDSAQIKTYINRTHTAKLLEIRLLGDRIEVRRGRTEHLSSELLVGLKDTLLAIAGQLPDKKSESV
ncbi:MAG: ParB/RepB/Spo0J family partition protein [Alphaproteobacteria bacterium]|nr:ParB/RepB/Spo0J family partition protein [Alphaproteobacteria bacterium]